MPAILEREEGQQGTQAIHGLTDIVKRLRELLKLSRNFTLTPERENELRDLGQAYMNCRDEKALEGSVRVFPRPWEEIKNEPATLEVLDHLFRIPLYAH